jgi:hypothetical protein
MIGKVFHLGHGKITDLYYLSLWVGGPVGLLLSSGSAILGGRPLSVLWILIFTGGTLASTLSIGHPWGHYLIQLVPFFAIGLGLLFSFQPLKRLSMATVYAVLLVSFVVMCRGIIADTIGQLKTNGMKAYGPNYALADHLRDKLQRSDTLFANYDILTYWLLHKTPLVPIAVFPANFSQESMTRRLYGRSVTSEDIIAELMSRNPTVIILTKNSELEQSDVFMGKLTKNYFLYGEVHDRRIFWNKHLSRGPQDAVVGN